MLTIVPVFVNCLLFDYFHYFAYHYLCVFPMISYETLSREREGLGEKKKNYSLDTDGDYLARAFLLSD